MKRSASARGDDLLIRGGVLLPMDPSVPDRVRRADVLVRGGVIERVSPRIEARGIPVLDALGLHVLPGFIVGHVHLCQTLFRNVAEGVALLQWLRRFIWPLEDALTREGVAASAWLSVAELVAGGATTFATMETVRHTDAAFGVLAESGVRAVVGQTLMDADSRRAPRSAWDRSRASIERLLERWHGHDDRLYVAVAPRFVLSCSDAMLRSSAEFAAEHGLAIHTHASEHAAEERAVRKRFGASNVRALERFGLLAERTLVAHCVQCDDRDLRLLAGRGASVAHCPSANGRLGSGVAPLRAMLGRGLSVSLGPDGAPCNNRLDVLSELRLAGIYSSLRDGPGAVSAVRLVRMLTCDGARAVGMGSRVGRIARGFDGDFVCLDLGRFAGPGGDPFTRAVYAASREDVRHVVCRGRVLIRDGDATGWDVREVVARARGALAGITRRSRART